MAEARQVNRILANETRDRIIDLLLENEKMSYGEIREMLGQINTGKLNYHLKALDGFVAKLPDTG